MKSSSSSTWWRSRKPDSRTIPQAAGAPSPAAFLWPPGASLWSIFPVNVYFLVGFLHSGLLWVTTGVSLLWLCRRIDSPAAVRLLMPVLLGLALCSLATTYALVIEPFVAHYSGAKYEMEAMKFRLSGPYAWFYWALLVFNTLPVAFLVPAVRRSMLWITGLSLPPFTAVVLQSLSSLGANAGAVP